MSRSNSPEEKEVASEDTSPVIEPPPSAKSKSPPAESNATVANDQAVLTKNLCAFCKKSALQPYYVFCCGSIYCKECLLLITKNVRVLKTQPRCFSCKRIFPQVENRKRSGSPPAKRAAASNIGDVVRRSGLPQGFPQSRHPDSEGSCGICSLQRPNNPVRTRCCGRISCKYCLVTAIRNTGRCPFCGEVFDRSENSRYFSEPIRSSNSASQAVQPVEPPVIQIAPPVRIDPALVAKFLTVPLSYGPSTSRECPPESKWRKSISRAFKRDSNGDFSQPFDPTLTSILPPASSPESGAFSSSPESNRSNSPQPGPSGLSFVPEPSSNCELCDSKDHTAENCPMDQSSPLGPEYLGHFACPICRCEYLTVIRGGQSMPCPDCRQLCHAEEQVLLSSEGE